MLAEQADSKVTRWCLNALAQLGTLAGSDRYIQIALTIHERSPEIVAAAVAALARIHNGNFESVQVLKSVDPQIRTLATMQIVDPKMIDLSGFRIDLEKADADVLKLALITVGLNRDIENLFHPKHSNGEFVKELGQHDDAIVRQYSVWAVIENKKLGIQNLGISFSNLDKQPSNVQAKMLQLAAEQGTDAKLRQNIIRHGSLNKSTEARQGLAKGLVNNYYEGLEDITVNWFDTEQVGDIKKLIAEHFARFSKDSIIYEKKALDVFEIDRSSRGSIYLGAEGTPLYGKLKALDERGGTKDLFSDVDPIAELFGGSVNLQQKKPRVLVLFLAANPMGADRDARLRLEQEARDLAEAIGKVALPTVEVSVHQEWATRTHQIQEKILNSRPKILHFSGHGKPGFLVFENSFGMSERVSGSAIAGIIELCTSIKCVLLNACFSETVAKEVAPHVEAVIGCSDKIDDDAAIKFSCGFYDAIARGENFERAFLLGKSAVKISSRPGEAEKYKILHK